MFLEVGEAGTAELSRVCQSRTGQKGLEGLAMRVWRCSECGAIDDRDGNSSRLILAAGHHRLAKGILALAAQAVA